MGVKLGIKSINRPTSDTNASLLRSMMGKRHYLRSDMIFKVVRMAKWGPSVT